MASFGQRFEMRPIFTTNFGMGFSNLYDKSFSSNSSCYWPSISPQSRNGQARQPREVWQQLRTCLLDESKQFEAELEAEGLPIDSLPLEAAMTLAAQEEARPLHKLSLVRILAILLTF